MAVRSRKPSRAICTRTQFTSSPHDSQVRHRSAVRSTPRQLSNGDQDPESPIGTFAPTAQPAQIIGKENRSPSTSSRPAVVATKKHRSHLQRVQFLSRPAEPLPATSGKPSDTSSGDTVDISLFPTARPVSPAVSDNPRPTAPKVLADQTTYPDDEPGLLEILSQSARSRSQSLARSRSQQRIPVEPRFELQVDYPTSCWTVTQAQIIARRLAESALRADAAGPSTWTNISPDTIRDRLKAKFKVARERSAANVHGQVVQYAHLPPPASSVCTDIGLGHRRSKAPQVPQFTHGSPVTDHYDEPPQPQHSFVHRPRYAGYSHTLYTPSRFEVKHTWSSDPMPKGPKQVVKIIIPFQDTPFLSANSVSSAEFVHLSQQEDNVAHLVPGPVAGQAEPARLVWMQSTAQAFIMALEQLLQTAEDQLQFGPILYYTTSSPPTSSDECAFVTLYVHFDQLCQARTLLATIDVATPGSRPHRPITPFASTHLSLLVLSTAGHPICLI